MLEIVKRLEIGQEDVNLGGDVYKERLPRPGEGKSVGFRIIVYFKNKFRFFFVYGFKKADRDNVDGRELKAFKADAKDQFALTNEQIIARLRNRTLIEVFMEDK